MQELPVSIVYPALNASSPPRRRRVATTTLGCKINSFETELISKLLGASGWQIVAKDCVADLYLINTCTVTREADNKARQSVRRAVRANPEALVVVTGCYAQMDPEACAAIPGVDLVLGNDRKLDLHHLMPQLMAGTLPKVMVGELDQHVSLPSELVDGLDGHTRAFIQIQQGCDQGCTFCIIHHARGPSRSLAPALIRRQAERLIMNGYKELVVCGVDLGSYAQDLDAGIGEMGLVSLLRGLLEIEGDFRLRLSSIDPAHISDQLIALFAAEPRLCPHIHLSLQSGHTMILKRMKRRYSVEQAAERIGKLRAAVPDLVLSADIMVGFPTETETHFEATLAAIEGLEIAYPHVFAYSKRPGTPAARIPSQVSSAIKKQRSAAAGRKGAEVLAKVLARQMGQKRQILVESGRDQQGLIGRCQNYLPVSLAPGQAEPGQLLRCAITAYDHSQLYIG